MQEAQHPSINIVAEKMIHQGQTRFEDGRRLPVGVAVNASNFAAKALAQVATEPGSLIAYAAVGAAAEVYVQDSSAFAAEGELLSFAQLQARCASVQQVLFGYYILPQSVEDPLEVEVNPTGGAEERAKPRVWNAGDGRCKMITLAQKRPRKPLAPLMDRATETVAAKSATGFETSN